MMKKFLYIARFPASAVLLLMWMALAPAMAQNVTNKNETTDLDIEPKPGETYSWELYSDSTLNFAVATGVTTSASYAEFVGGNTGAKVSVKWKEVGTYFFKITAWNTTGCTNNIEIGKMKVLPPLPEGTITTTPVCSGDPVKLKIDLTEVGPWSLTYTDGTTIWTEKNITSTPWEVTVTPGPGVDTEYWILTVTNPNGTNKRPSPKVMQVIYPAPKSSVIYLHEP